MPAMRWGLLLSALLISGCKLKTSESVSKPPDEKPVTCVRALNAEIPTSFASEARPIGAVRTSDCGTLAIGMKGSEVMLSRFNAQGVREESYGDRGVYKPFQFRYAEYAPKAIRLAIVADGILILGEATRPVVEFLAFRVLDDGYLDNGFGPLRDGVIRAGNPPGWELASFGVPSIEGEQVRLPARYLDPNKGIEVERPLSFHIHGRQAMTKEAIGIPSECDLIVHDSYQNGVHFSFRQSGCATLDWSLRDKINERMQVPMNGTTQESAWLGEFRWHYEGRMPVLVSRDGLGNVRKEYVFFASGGWMCGKSLPADRRYLIFSRTRPGQGDWTSNCWYL